MALSDEDREKIASEFKDSVNMTPKQIEKWLNSDESKAVGQKKSAGESTGHASGRRIIEIKGKKKSELTDDDYAHMRKVNSYVKRHLAQKPAKESIEDSKWRFSLMNWGYDPLKK